MRGADDCWLWQAGTFGTVMGYGCFYDRGRMRYAHRVAYELEVGAVPEGMELDHTCRQPLCVNPAHLQPVTHAENVRRGEAGRYHKILAV